MRQAVDSLCLRRHPGPLVPDSVPRTPTMIGARTRMHTKLTLSLDYSKHGMNTVSTSEMRMVFMNGSEVITTLLLGDRIVISHGTRRGCGAPSKLYPKGLLVRIGRSSTRTITGLVLFGDSIDGSELRGPLEEILGSELFFAAKQFEPVFSAAICRADMVYGHASQGPWILDKKPARGCCWSSKFHSCMRNTSEDRLGDDVS